MSAQAARQRVFDLVLNALRCQGEASLSEKGGCAYRSPDGNKCAIGHLIPDSLYRPDLEGLFSYQLVDREPEILSHLEETYGLELMGGSQEADYSQILLSRLQRLHDSELRSYSVGAWETAMCQLASEFNLTYTEPSHEPA